MARLPGGIFPRLVALFPLLFPLYLFRGSFSGVPVTLSEVVLGVMFAWFLLQLLGRGRELRLRSGMQEWKLWPVYLFLGAAVVSVLVVPESAFMVDGTEFPTRMKALGILKGWILTPLVYFVMARSVFREKPSLIPFAVRAMLVSGALLSLLALKQVWTGEYLTLDGRASGPFESANYLSLYLTPLVLYVILALKESEKIRERIFLGLAGGICLLGLYFTFSYAAWLALFAGLALAGLLQIREKRKVFWLTIAGLALLGGGLVFGELGTEKFTQFFEIAERSSTSVRLQVYEISLGLLKQNPFLGIGLGQFEQQYQEVALRVLGEAPFEWNMLHPHNVFLAFWLNMGLAGLVAFVWLCGKALLWLTESPAESRHTKERQMAALMLVVILVHGLFDTPYFKNDLAFQFWLLMAILL